MNTKIKVHAEYVHERIDGQKQTFGRWAVSFLDALMQRDPRLAPTVDLSKLRTCDRLFQHYSLDKETPEVAAESVSSLVAAHPEYLQ